MKIKCNLICTCSAIVLFFISASTNCFAQVVNVEENMMSGSTKWTSKFDIHITPHHITVKINISLLISNGVNRPGIDEKIDAWNNAINSIWNNRFYTYLENKKLPIKINVKFTHHQPHHRVVVHPGRWVPNQHNWHMETPSNVIAHEIGHMLGAYDEYRGGALSPVKLIDTTSIMGSKPIKSVAYPRHLALLEKKLISLSGNKQLKIKQY